MKKQILCVTLLLLISFTLPLTATAQVVNIPDPNLRALIKASGATITVQDMARLRELHVFNISDLTGLEYAINLGQLSISGTSIADISVLTGLTNLNWLGLSDNGISDISALAGLTNLRSLDLSNNSISDISALAGLTNLNWLDLSDNSISDISALVELTGFELVRPYRATVYQTYRHWRS